MSRYQEWNEAEAREIVAPYERMPGGLLPALHAVQARFGYISDDAIRVLADVVNLSRAEVHGVVSFYHDFRREPPGRHIVRLCQAEACQAMGCRALAASAKESLGVDFHGTTQDGVFSLEAVYCLGNCACSPAVMIDDQVFGRVTPQRLHELLAEYRNGGAAGG